MYYKAPGSWTSDIEDAFDFDSGPEAVLLARESGWVTAEVFWDSDDPEYSVRLPVTPSMPDA